MVAQEVTAQVEVLLGVESSRTMDKEGLTSALVQAFEAGVESVRNKDGFTQVPGQAGLTCARCGKEILPGDVCGCPSVSYTCDFRRGGRRVLCQGMPAHIVGTEKHEHGTIFLLETEDGIATQWTTRDRFELR